jgi:hypothetical protein
MAAEGMQFSWRWNGATVFPKLDVIWGMPTQAAIRGIPVQGGDPTLVADEYLHPSGKVYTPWADTIVPLAEMALLKEETP